MDPRTSQHEVYDPSKEIDDVEKIKCDVCRKDMEPESGQSTFVNLQTT